MFKIIYYILALNATRFKDNPITIREALLTINWFGIEDYIHYLKQWYDEEFHYDEETL